MIYAIDTSRKSPNWSSRHGADVSMLVLHSTVGSYSSSLKWLTNPKSRVSTHYLIRKDGHIAQLVADEYAAWHAGDSFWHGLDSEAIQHRSLGIELENANDGHDPYPPLQIDAAFWLCQQKIARYAIERADVARHLDIAIPKGRKTDPAGFPWLDFANGLYLHITPPPPPHAGLTHYKVKALVTGGATIRAAPAQNAASLGRLHAGDDWWGEPVTADKATTVAGFGSSKVWIRSDDQRCVWSGLLQEVK